MIRVIPYKDKLSRHSLVFDIEEIDPRDHDDTWILEWQTDFDPRGDARWYSYYKNGEVACMQVVKEIIAYWGKGEHPLSKFRVRNVHGGGYIPGELL
jgi:hypothetical protein